MTAQFGLAGLAAVMVALAALAAAGEARVLPPRVTAPATAALSLLAGLAGLAVLLAGGRAELFAGALAIDPLGAFFLLLPALAGLAAACGAWDGDAPHGLPGLVGAGLLVVLAADAGIAVLGLSLYALAASGGLPRAMPLAGVFLLAGAFAVLAVGAGTGFPVIRTHPPEGLRAVLLLVLVLAGLLPLLAGSLGQAVVQLPVAAVNPGLGLYLAVRMLADLGGPATPAWWSLPLLLAGAMLALAGVAAGMRGESFASVLGGLAVQHGGWMLAGLGVASAARAADVLPLATLALGGAMLHALNHAAFASLAALCAQAVKGGAGSDTLDRLGGLAARMKLVAVGMLLAGLSLALLPPGAGFASGWMVLQALFAAPRLGGLPLQLAAALGVCALAASAGFGAVAAIRLGGLAFLGRPRTPRCAAAEDAGPAMRGTIAALAGLCGLLGAFPGVALRLAADAQRGLTGSGLDGQGDWAGLRAQWDLPGYAPLALITLLGLGLAVVALLVRGGVLPGTQPVPAWEDGFAAPPPWMPFGDPATQLSAASLATTLPRRQVGLAGWPWVRLQVELRFPPLARGHAPLAVLGLAVLLLLAVAVLAPP